MLMCFMQVSSGKGWNYMELPESGNVEDLVRYRIDTAKSDLQSVQMLIGEKVFFDKKSDVKINYGLK